MYSLKNTTTNPVRPLGLMVGIGDAADGSSCRMLAGDVPVIISDSDYAYAKNSIEKYVKAGMLKCENLAEDKKTGNDDSEKDRKSELERITKEQFGVDIDRRKSLPKLEAEYADLVEKAGV